MGPEDQDPKQQTDPAVEQAAGELNEGREAMRKATKREGPHKNNQTSSQLYFCLPGSCTREHVPSNPPESESLPLTH